jgi:putative transposase
MSVRAGLCARGEDYPWSSAAACGAAVRPVYWHAGPVARPEPWLDWVTQPATAAEEEALRTSVQRGRPFGSVAWSQSIAAALGLEATLRPRGRPRKVEASAVEIDAAK